MMTVLFLWVQMDALNRSCVVSAHLGSHQVRLVVKFPVHYPNNAVPTFQFVSPTSIPSAMRTKIQKVNRLLSDPEVHQYHSDTRAFSCGGDDDDDGDGDVEWWWWWW